MIHVSLAPGPGPCPVREVNQTPALEVSHGLDLDLDLRVVLRSQHREVVSLDLYQRMLKTTRDDRQDLVQALKTILKYAKKKTVFRKNGTIDLIKTVLTAKLKMIRVENGKNPYPNHRNGDKVERGAGTEGSLVEEEAPRDEEA